MKIKIIKIIIVITVITGWIVFPARRAEAVIKRAGQIEVIVDEPLFADLTVWYPGLRVEKSFQVKNRGGGVKMVQIEAENESETLLLPGALTIQIKEGARGIFGVADSKTLRNFFDASAINLGEVFPDDSGETFSVAMAMPAAAGNEYQGGVAKFDLRIGFVGDGASAVTVSSAISPTPTPASGQTSILGTAANTLTGGEDILGEATTSGEENLGGGDGEVAGLQTEGVDWGFWAMIGGIFVSGGLAGLVWWRRLGYHFFGGRSPTGR